MIRRQLLFMSAPIIGLHVLNVAMPAIDAALCARLPGAEHVLAGIGISVQVVLLSMMAIVGLTIGTVALVGRAHGAKSMERVNHLLAQSTQLAIFLAIAIAASGFFLARPILLALHASPEAADVGTQYLRIWMIGTPFAYVNLLYAGVLRAVGSPRIPFLCALGAVIVNAAASYALVLGKLGMPALGVRGAPLASIGAQALELLILVWVLRRGRVAGIRLSRLPQPVDRHVIGDLLRVGWPAAADLLVVNAGFLAVFGMLANVDELAVAAHAIVMRVWMVAFVFSLGISLGTAALIGEALGAGNVDRSRQIGRVSLQLCAVSMTIFSFAIVAFAPKLVSLFDVPAGTPLERYAVQGMAILGLAVIPASLDIVLVGLLQGAGATPASLRVNMVNTFFIQIPTAWLLGFAMHLGAYGIWLSFPVAFCTKALLDYAVYKRERWAITGVSLGLVAVILAAGPHPAYAQQPPPPVNLPPVNRNPEFTDGAGGPGFFVHVIADASRATHLVDGHGSDVPGSFSLSTLTAISHVGMTLPIQILGGFWGADVLLPATYVAVERDGRSDRAAGLGDLSFSPIVLQWPAVRIASRPFFLQRLALNLTVPTGAYDPSAAANTGANVFRFNPYYAFTVFVTEALETSFRIHYLWNSANESPAVDYRANDIQPGQAIHVNGAMSYPMIREIRLGIMGSFLSQVTDSRIDGRAISGTKEQVAALGPAIRVDIFDLFSATVNANWEFAVENRPSGFRAGLSVIHVWPSGSPAKN